MKTYFHTNKLFNLLILFMLLTSTTLGSAVSFQPQSVQAAALSRAAQSLLGYGSPVIDGVIDP
ncbi:MAG: hypothetical protein ACK2T5_13590, partial [Anaerolineales bacterium]